VQDATVLTGNRLLAVERALQEQGWVIVIERATGFGDSPFI
jgi:hypothetical protein